MFFAHTFNLFMLLTSHKHITPQILFCVYSTKYINNVSTYFYRVRKKKQKASIFKTDFCMHFTKSTVFAIFKFFLGAIFLLFLFLSDSSYDCIYSISLQWQITFTLVFCFSNVEIEEIEKNQTNIYYYFLLAFSIFIDSKHKLEAISTISIWNAHFSIHLW